MYCTNACCGAQTRDCVRESHPATRDSLRRHPSPRREQRSRDATERHAISYGCAMVSVDRAPAFVSNRIRRDTCTTKSDPRTQGYPMAKFTYLERPAIVGWLRIAGVLEPV